MESTAKHDWPMVRLGDVCEILNGFAFSSNKFGAEGDMPIIRIRDVVSGTTSTYYSGDWDEKYLIQAGEILVGMDGDFNYARWNSAPALLNQRVCKVSADEQHITDAYLFHVLQFPLHDIWEKTAFVTVKHLSAKRLAEALIPLPPLDEQRRIAAILDEAKKLSSSQAAKLACLREFLDARSSRIAEEANAVKRLDELCDVQGGISLGGARKSYPESAPYLRVANVFRNAIDLREVKNVPVRESELEKYSLLSGDILVVEAHGNRFEVGRGAVLTESLEGHVYQNHLFRVRPNKGIDSEILVQLWNSPRVRKQILSIVSTTSGLNTTSISKIRSIQVPILTSEVQAEFSELLHDLTELITQEEQKLNRVLELSNSLSTRAFQGEL